MKNAIYKDQPVFSFYSQKFPSKSGGRMTATPKSTDVRVLANRRAARMSIRDAATNGSRRDLLAAMRDMVASELDQGVPARELASCTRQLLLITKEIEAIDSASGGDEVGVAAATPDEEWTTD